MTQYTWYSFAPCARIVYGVWDHPPTRWDRILFWLAGGRGPGRLRWEPVYVPPVRAPRAKPPCLEHDRRDCPDCL